MFILNYSSMSVLDEKRKTDQEELFFSNKPFIFY